MCSAYPAICRGIHSSHSALVIGRNVSSASVTELSNQPNVVVVKDGNAAETARSVAAHRLEYERVAAGYGDPAADESLAADVAAGREPNRGRMHEYLRARTAFFDRAVVNSLDHGTAQVVIGGPGYDGRALRYAKQGVRWFELDDPATQADKIERVARLGAATGHLRFIPADFTADPIVEPLLAAGLDPARPTLFWTALPAPRGCGRTPRPSRARYEQVPGPSLAVSATVLRVLGPAGVRTRDLPALAIEAEWRAASALAWSPPSVRRSNRWLSASRPRSSPPSSPTRATGGPGSSRPRSSRTTR